MYRGYFCAFALMIGLLFADQSTADVVDTSGAGFNIPDNNAGGASSMISIGADEMISNVEINLFGFTHTWVGDLIVSVTSPSGATEDLFYRVGPGFFGDSSSLNGNYTFADGGANFAAAAAATGANATIPIGTYQPSTDGDVPVSLATVFGGESTLGDWTLTVSDNAAFDTGSLGGWGLNISSSVTAVPEPGPLMLFAVLGSMILKRRRRNRNNV